VPQPHPTLARRPLPPPPQLSNNHITHLPAELGSCSRLQALALHGNALCDLPDSLTQLVQLRALAATSNRLARLPESIGAMTSLRLLDISHNCLQVRGKGRGSWWGQGKGVDVAGGQPAALQVVA
jgi:hypothetical protein